MGCLTPIASAEVTANDLKGLLAAAPSMPAGMPVYIAALPTTTASDLVDVAKAAFERGLRPVPHLVARNFASHQEFETMLRRLVEDAGVRRALVLGGDRDAPDGPYGSALDLLKTSLFSADTIPNVAFGCYPEGHPKIPLSQLETALFDKLEAAALYGLNARLITQICFSAESIINFVRDLREKGVSTPLRYGVVGPTKLTTLLKYAAMCGVGASLRSLQQRRDLGSHLLSGYTPSHLIETISAAAQRDGDLRIIGPHFFTFGSLKRSVDWMAGSNALKTANSASA